MRRWGAGAGVLAALSGVAAAEGFAALIGSASPVVAVGTATIDAAPAWLRTFAIETFGVNDKPVLVAGMVLTIALLGALAGALGVPHRRWALGLTLAIGAVGVLAAATARGATDMLLVRVAPAMIAAAVGVVGLSKLLDVLNAPIPAPAAGPAPTPKRAVLTDRPDGPPAPSTTPEMPAVMIPGRRPELGLDRRAFVRAAGAVGAVGLAGGALWRVNGANTTLTTEGLVTLPRPRSPAHVVSGADFGIPGLTPYLTRNQDFYRIDTALVVPRVEVDGWKLHIHGMVERPITLGYDDLLRAPLIERDVTLICVSNEVGGYYNGTARWLGVRISDVLAAAGVRPGADAVRSRSVDGWTCGTPLSALTDPRRDAMFAIGMNGEPLPYEHGFPVRLVVPGLYGFVSATKWLTDLEVTRFDAFEAYWTQRGWAPQAPIKTASRIEVPEPNTATSAIAPVLAGMAWAPHRGIGKVEVRIDDEWRTAELAPWANPDTWRQWRIADWRPTRQIHSFAVRATDGTGAVQTAQLAEPVPDGASGYHLSRARFV